MAKLKNSSQVSVEFKDWTDLKNPGNENSQCFRIVMLHMYEKIGGDVAGGEMELWVDGYDEAMKYITDKNDGTIILTDEKEEGLTFEVPIYITSREFMSNTVSIQFKCIKDINFLTKLVSINYQDGIKNTIAATYPGESDFRIEPGVNDIILFQNNETNYEFNKRLAYSYKDKSIFAYGWEGFMIKDLMGDKDSRGNTEPKLKIYEGKLLQQTEAYNLKYDTTLNHDPFDPWTAPEDCTTKTDHSADKSQNLSVLIDHDSYTVVGKDLETYQQNWYSNMKMMTRKGFIEFKSVATDMPSYKIGDVLIYMRKKQEDENIKLPFEHFLVASNELFYSIDGSKKVSSKRMKFSWTTTFYGLDEGIWSKDKE